MIILFNPRSSPIGKPVLPMSLLSIAAVIDGHRDYCIVDGNLDEDPLATLCTLIEANDCPVVAMTVMPGRQVRQARDVSRGIKARFPQVSIIWGGYFPTMYPNASLSESSVDYLLRGHSEEAFVALLDALDADSGWRNQAGLSSRDRQSGVLTHNPMGPVPKLDALPDYPYHRLDMERYVLDTFLGHRTLSHHASYGCPFTCNFCGVVNMVNGKYSAQSPETLERQVDTLVNRYRADAIQFYDNNFFVSESRSAEICERLKPYGINWWAYGRVDTLMKYSDKTWSLMRDSGLKMIYIGAEAGSDDTLDRMNKGGKQTADLGIEITRRMKAHGIVPELSFVVACPPDPEADVERTFNYIRRIKAIDPAAEIILYPYTPVPVEGQLLDDVESMGFEFPESIDDWASDEWIAFSERTTAALPWLSASTQAHIGDFQRVLHAAYPTNTDPTLRGVKRALIRLAGLWRYKLRYYHNPVELRVLNRLLPHKRPEVTGF